MQQIINYIIDNWMWLFPIVLSVVEFLILFIFRRIKYIDSSICFKLIPFIKQAESIYGSGHGVEKLNYVIKQYQQICPDANPSIISYFVNEILDTPQKKGGK